MAITLGISIILFFVIICICWEKSKNTLNVHSNTVQSSPINYNMDDNEHQVGPLILRYNLIDKFLNRRFNGYFNKILY